MGFDGISRVSGSLQKHGGPSLDLQNTVNYKPYYGDPQKAALILGNPKP